MQLQPEIRIPGRSAASGAVLVPRDADAIALNVPVGRDMPLDPMAALYQMYQWAAKDREMLLLYRRDSVVCFYNLLRTMIKLHGNGGSLRSRFKKISLLNRRLRPGVNSILMAKS